MNWYNTYKIEKQSARIAPKVKIDLGRPEFDNIRSKILNYGNQICEKIKERFGDEEITHCTFDYDPVNSFRLIAYDDDLNSEDEAQITIEFYGYASRLEVKVYDGVRRGIFEARQSGQSYYWKIKAYIRYILKYYIKQIIHQSGLANLQTVEVTEE